MNGNDDIPANAPKSGDRVQVTYEATYEEGQGVSGGHYVRSDSSTRAGLCCYVPAYATIEILKPPLPDEPKLIAAVVEVDGKKYVRVDSDSRPWARVGGLGDWFSWGNVIQSATTVKVISPGIEA